MSQQHNDQSSLAVKGKSVSTAYLFWGFLGLFGAYQFYLGRTVVGVVALGVTILFVALFVAAGVVYEVALSSGAIDDVVDPNNLEPEELTSSLLYIGGFVVLGARVIWWIVDAFLITRYVKNYNHLKQLAKYKAEQSAVRQPE